MLKLTNTKMLLKDIYIESRIRRKKSMSIKIFPGSIIFSSRKDIYIVECIIVFVLGFAYLISAFLSSWRTEIFYLLVIVGLILMLTAFILLIFMLKKSKI